jgi:hypothetical protein
MKFITDYRVEIAFEFVCNLARHFSMGDAHRYGISHAAAGFTEFEKIKTNYSMLHKHKIKTYFALTNR